ncbi:MAG: lysophospholipid acyltransferase family protein [Gemmataceae bacterium]|nr:lysophospholipid acyltransferase family protein [Gemmataceae bacterium]
MSKQRSRITDYIVYLVVRLVACFIQALSPDLAATAARGLAWLAYRIDRRHRLVAHDNLRHAFPEIARPEERDRLVRSVYLHFCTLLMDILLTPRRLHAHNWRRHVELPHVRAMVEAILSPRPVLIVTGHFGNWEMGGYAMGLLGFRTAAIARRLDNPYLDDFLRRRFREGTGQTILDKNDDYERIQAVLAEGGLLATLGDQDAGQRGLFVDFFGRPASTHKAVVLLAREYQAVMLVIGVRRIGSPMCYEVVVEDVIYPEQYEDKPQAVREMTQRFTSALERLIRRNPEQYFWLHRRWKHEPPKRKSKSAAA